MRIDSLSYYTTSLSGIQNGQSAIARVSQQLSTGKEMLAAKDDPLAASRALELSDRISLRAQSLANQAKASIALKYENTVLQGLRSTLDQARTTLQGVGQEPEPTNRTSATQILKGAFHSLLAYANSRDAEGNYIFAGDKSATSPYANASGGDFSTTPASGVATTFNGSASTRSVEIDTGRLVQVQDNLNTVFQSGVAGADLLQTLDEAAARLPLPTGNASAVTDTATLQGYIQVLDDALSNLGLIEQRVGAAMKEISDVQSTSKALQNMEQDALDRLTEVDQAAAIIELQTRQTTLQAASQAYAKTSSLSLFNYLS